MRTIILLNENKCLYLIGVQITIKIDDGMEIVNIISISNNVVFKYTVPTDS